MATVIMTRQKLIAWITKNVSNSQIILLSEDIDTVSCKPKKNEKKVTFAFANDAFKEQDGIAHIAFGKTPVRAFSILKKEDASPQVLDMLKQTKANPARKKK